MAIDTAGELITDKVSEHWSLTNGLLCLEESSGGLGASSYWDHLKIFPILLKVDGLLGLSVAACERARGSTVTTYLYLM